MNEAAPLARPPAPPDGAAGAPAMVAVIGHPNAGKTSLFNALTGRHQKVGNYPGVTVERKAGRVTLPSGRIAELVEHHVAALGDPCACEIDGAFHPIRRGGEDHLRPVGAHRLHALGGGVVGHDQLDRIAA